MATKQEFPWTLVWPHRGGDFALVTAAFESVSDFNLIRKGFKSSLSGVEYESNYRIISFDTWKEMVEAGEIEDWKYGAKLEPGTWGLILDSTVASRPTQTELAMTGYGRFLESLDSFTKGWFASRKALEVHEVFHVERTSWAGDRRFDFIVEKAQAHGIDFRQVPGDDTVDLVFLNVQEHAEFQRIFPDKHKCKKCRPLFEKFRWLFENVEA